MGFYSFYRIFKDIIRTLFGNKAFKYFLIFAIICIIILFANRTFAVEPSNYVVDYYTTGYTAHSQDLTGYWYWFIPVFANSSYSISWPSGTELSFGFIDNLTRLINTGYSFDIKSFNYIQSNNQGSYGYFAVKDGYLVVIQREYDYPNKVTLNITTDYDFTANLATIHQDLRALITGSGDPSVSTSSSSVSGLVAASYGRFVNDSRFSTYYIPVNKDTSYLMNVISSATASSYLRFGYCSTVPALNVTHNGYSTWDSIGFSDSYEFTATSSSYFYVCVNNEFVSNISFSSNVNLMQNISQQAQQTRDTLTDSNISQDTSDYNLPVDNTNNITSDGFAHIFERIRTAFTTASTTSLVFTVPFTNKSITVNYDTVYSNANLGVVRDIFQAFWNFIIALWITKDIAHKINKIKSGNLEFTETTNIKEEIL